MGDAPVKKKQYEESQMVAAIAAVKNGMSLRSASIFFEVPASTVRDRLSGRYAEGKHRPGPSVGLSAEQESILKQHLLNMTQIGYGFLKKDILPMVKEILDKAEMERLDMYCLPDRKFQNNTPSIGWVYRFINRHPALSKVPEHFGLQKTEANEGQVQNWFEELVKFLHDEHGIEAAEFLAENNARRIFNLDECFFPLAGNNCLLQAITTRGIKKTNRSAPDSRDQISVLSCTSAAGDFTKPFVIFPTIGPKLNIEGVQSEDFDLSTSQNGWMSADYFLGWLQNHFYPSIRDKVEFPILIFLDGHSSHINLAISSFCRANKIILYCFPPHSQTMQPLDVAVYGPLKKQWNNSLNDYGREFAGQPINRSYFFYVFDRAWKKCIENKNTIVSGFRECGLVPLNTCAVAYSQILEKCQPRPKEKVPEISMGERVGMMRMFQMIESCLGDNLKELFSIRFCNGYDVDDESDHGKLYQCYRKCRTLMESGLNAEPQEVSLSAPYVECSLSSEPDSRELNSESKRIKRE